MQGNAEKKHGRGRPGVLFLTSWYSQLFLSLGSGNLQCVLDKHSHDQMSDAVYPDRSKGARRHHAKKVQVRFLGEHRLTFFENHHLCQFQYLQYWKY